MTQKNSLIAFGLVLLMILASSVGSVIAQGPGSQLQQSAIGTAFTYQGQLKNASGPVNDNCDFQFSVWNASGAGTSLASDFTHTNIPVSQGLFTVQLDFGVNVFNGEARWLEIAVRCPAGAGDYATLIPRQPLTPAPYALFSTSTGALQGRSITTTTPISGQVLKWDGNIWSPADDAIGVPGSGDISAVNAGYGLSGGGTSGDVTLAVNYAGSGTAPTVARSDHNHWGAAWTGSGTGLSLSGGSMGLVSSGTTTGTAGIATSASGATTGVYGSANSPNGSGVYGFNPKGTGVFGSSHTGIGVDGASNTLWGVYGWSSGNAGVFGSGASPTSTGVYGTAPTTGTIGIATGTSGSTAGVYGSATSPEGAGVYGTNSNGPGIWGNSSNNIAVYGTSTNGTGMYGFSSSNTGVYGYSPSGIGLFGDSSSNTGIYGRSSSNVGVYGKSTSGTGMYGTAATTGTVGIATGTSGVVYGVWGSATASTGGIGVCGRGSIFGVAGYSSDSGDGVYGYSPDGFGVNGVSVDSVGVRGFSTNAYGVYGASPGGYAGYFSGNVHVFGNLSASGTKPFKIDNPLDPANQYLYHYAVESPQVQNAYNGTIVLDAKGEAVVNLPDYFSAINRGEFQYQLTAIGASMPNLYIAAEITGNHFKIAGGVAGKKVSWMVFGQRSDPWVRDHPQADVVDKPDDETGTYLYPQGYGQPETSSADYAFTHPVVSTSTITPTLPLTAPQQLP